MSDRTASRRIWIITALIVLAGGVVPAGAAEKPVFKAGENGEYTFDTGVLRGTLCAGGKSSGLTSVVHIPTGTRLDKGSGIFGYYRLLATNQRFGRMGWDIPGKSRLLDDGAVEITLVAAEDRPFELVAVYRWADPATLDLETTIKPTADLSNFELFLASYCSDSFPSPYVRARKGFLLAERSYGDWLAFLRDEGVAKFLRDGRWEKEPYPVTWTPVDEFDEPLAFRRGTESAPRVVLMAPRQDCFAVSTPYSGESHYSLYLSLFGSDLKVGAVAQAKSRLVVTMADSGQDILDLYQAYMRKLNVEK